MTFAQRSEEILEIRNRNCPQPIRHQYGAWFSLDCRYQSCSERLKSRFRNHLSTRVCRLSRPCLLSSNLIPSAAASSTSSLDIFLRDSGNAGSFLRDRPRDTEPSHLSKQR